ncbi:hypothetical protein ABENE_19440 [Asticcacaulis benevestitus DSM 16100 = ATCC BAA-896]|uniref:Uncharacterized protein n=1 Tax=Asticcacaulis benevestitus DSM 16100 = ATCC BAA-896 TaxID=1121022 RepID=V4NT46_9CAUL|nr:hypothetical protein ABENE_19440 [Asticcacaulis benevestitus DSM 16100 = ATCC BAA-896]
MRHLQADEAFKLRFRAEAMEAAARAADVNGDAEKLAEKLRKAAADLKRQAFRIEETGR